MLGSWLGSGGLSLSCWGAKPGKQAAGSHKLHAQGTPSNETRELLSRLEDCELFPFAPQICYNLFQGLRPFPNPGRQAFAVLCQYPILSLSHSGPRQCLVAAKSVQTTRTQHGLILLVPPNASVQTDFQEVCGTANIKIRHEQPVPIPAAAVASAHAGGRHGWVHAFQKLVAFSLFDFFSKLVTLDSDTLLLDNVDWLFSLPGSAMGADCTPHFNSPERYWVRGAKQA